MHERVTLTGCSSAESRRIEHRLERAARHRALLEGQRRAAIDSDGTGQWFVVRHSGDGESLAKLMAVEGITAWCPVEKVKKSCGRVRKVVWVNAPLWAGYILVKVPALPAAWLGVMSFDGVAGFLGMGGIPLALKDKAIKEIQAFIALPPARRKLIFAPDARVLIRHNSFEGIEGTVVASENAKGRVGVEIELLGRMTLCWFGLDELKLL